MDEGTSREKQNKDLEEWLSSFVKEHDGVLSVEYDNGTYEIDGDVFTLTFAVDDETFEIRSIDVRKSEGKGLGRTIIDSIHAYADEHGLEVVASKVQDTARGFWEKAGYEEGAGAEGEYVRIT